MAKAFLYGNGGYNIDTDKITATTNDIIQGKTAYIDDSGEIQTGILPLNAGQITGTNHMECDDNVVVGTHSLDGKDRLYMRPTNQITARQAYEADTWFTKEVSKLAAPLGVTSDKIIIGNTIMGVQGTGYGRWA